MINSLGPGEPLPAQPPGSLGSSDIATMRQLTRTVVPASLTRLIGDCLHRKIAGQRSSALGWAQAGKYKKNPLPLLLLILSISCFGYGRKESLISWLIFVGQMGNIGIFIVGTRSEMDRRITGAIHPSPPRLDDTEG